MFSWVKCPDPWNKQPGKALNFRQLLADLVLGAGSVGEWQHYGNYPVANTSLITLMFPCGGSMLPLGLEGLQSPQ
jgi:hypothetical protein